MCNFSSEEVRLLIKCGFYTRLYGVDACFKSTQNTTVLFRNVVLCMYSAPPVEHFLLGKNYASDLFWVHAHCIWQVETYASFDPHCSHGLVRTCSRVGRFSGSLLSIEETSSRHSEQKLSDRKERERHARIFAHIKKKCTKESMPRGNEKLDKKERGPQKTVHSSTNEILFA